MAGVITLRVTMNTVKRTPASATFPHYSTFTVKLEHEEEPHGSGL